ncbi:phosphoribosylformylglycinamidine synthase [Blattabacterium cuenoti]|uniref:phosphoribosylformylglycinamidine synthase n=1 Tax=Blattabacterium cuenoti TaxID=1653831 RepID=UPI00163D12B6|nr:phosphoribosylformylglycinamidine synthase [Blattabacterium cuenoti]
MNLKIFIQKKPYFDTDSIKLYNELCNLHTPLVNGLIIYCVYNIYNINKKLFLESLYKIFADPVTDILHINKNFNNPCFKFFSDYDEIRSDSATQCLKILDYKSCAYIKSSYLVELFGIDKNKKEYLNSIKEYLKKKKSLNIHTFSHEKVSHNHNLYIDGFINFSVEKLIKFHKKFNFSMNIMDLIFIQKYFIKEKRNPTEIELQVLDVFWSDHCRHITFFTSLIDISFKGSLKNMYNKIFNKYLEDRHFMGISKKPINLMELSSLPYKVLCKKGKLKHEISSLENNACMIMIDVDFTDRDDKEKWYIFFKNETHNHPTEIDPFNGAATCVGGAIRDPLSGRSYVYQGLRLSGAANPKNTKTFYGKLPQNKICFEAARGYSYYGNRIGLATTHVREIYHEGYRAKRMEIGMVVGAVPKNFVKQKKLKKGDIIMLIGGMTGKEGVGGAIDSSKSDNFNFKNNVKQKWDPLTERKIQRFFRKKEVTYLIKKCNDFGAGGVSVAIGELNDSIKLYLDKIPIKKNQGIITPIDIALSESQERMAVALDSKHAEKFISLAKEENLLSVPIAEITDNNRIIFMYEEKELFNIKSSFLNTRGFCKKQSVIVNTPTSISPFKQSRKLSFNKKTFFKTLSKLNVASQINLSEMFDSTVGGTTVLMPFGGKYQMTPSEGSVQKIPVMKGNTNTVSIVAWGYHPEISVWSPFHGGIYSIIECISKIVSMGGDFKNIYFSFQEYFQKLGNDPENWGKPFSSLLGAYHAQMSLGIGSIGGKDSMSGSYKKLNVPPTFITFGVSTSKSLYITSPEFKKIGNIIYLYYHRLLKNDMPDFESIKNIYNKIYQGIKSGKIVSVKTIKDGGISSAIAEMSFGNRLGAIIDCKYNLLEISIGSLIIEASSFISNDLIKIGEVTSYDYLIFNGINISIDEAINNWTNTFNSVFSFNKEKYKKEKYKKNISKNTYRVTKNFSIICKSNYKGIPRVLIPIFPGTNGEFESVRAFEKEKSIIKTFVFRNLRNEDVISSSLQLTKYIKSSQIIMICGGFSAGDEPDGAGKFISSILHNPYIKDSVKNFLDKDGLILGICNGFQGLIKSGLLPYGKICLRNNNSPTLTYNKIGKHISKCVNIKIISDKSPWLNGMKNKIYILPISHGEGKFYAKKKIISTLFKKQQVAAQYVDFKGNPSSNSIHNPNGSISSIEGIISQDGRIYGRMTHPERYDEGLLKNIPNIREHSIFKNAVQYFL